MRGLANRREFFMACGGAAGGLAAGRRVEPAGFVIVTVQAMFDQGAHSGKGLGEAERSKFQAYQEKARRSMPPAESSSRYTRSKALICGSKDTRKSFEIPGAGARINLFVTDTLGYDIDRDRTGGCSMGPRPPSRRSGGDPFYKSFLGLRDAHDTTLPHELRASLHLGYAAPAYGCR